jgi:hypothetical protein
VVNVTTITLGGKKMSKANVTKKTVASKYRQGNGWIVSSYSPQYDGWTTSDEMNYWAACTVVKNARETWNTKTQKYIEWRAI